MALHPAPGIVRIEADRIDELGPLWLAMHAHHEAVAPALRLFGALAEPEELWLRRRSLYERWIAEPGAFCLAADSGGTLVGYVMVRVRGPRRVWEPQDRIGVVETLSVLAAPRGQGVGSRLMDEVAAELTRLRIEGVELSVLVGNDDAARFYERLGLTPSLTTMHGRLTGP